MARRAAKFTNLPIYQIYHCPESVLSLASCSDVLEKNCPSCPWGCLRAQEPHGREVPRALSTYGSERSGGNQGAVWLDPCWGLWISTNAAAATESCVSKPGASHRDCRCSDCRQLRPGGRLHHRPFQLFDPGVPKFKSASPPRRSRKPWRPELSELWAAQEGCRLRAWSGEGHQLDVYCDWMAAQSHAPGHRGTSDAH